MLTAPRVILDSGKRIIAVFPDTITSEALAARLTEFQAFDSDATSQTLPDQPDYDNQNSLLGKRVSGTGSSATLAAAVLTTAEQYSLLILEIKQVAWSVVDPQYKTHWPNTAKRDNTYFWMEGLVWNAKSKAEAYKTTPNATTLAAAKTALGPCAGCRGSFACDMVSRAH